MPVRGYVHINCIYDYITFFFGCFIVNLPEKNQIKSNIGYAVLFPTLFPKATSLNSEIVHL